MGLDKGGIFLSDLEEQELAAYLPCWKKDTNHLGKPIRLAGIEYAKGLLLHPEESLKGNRARVAYALVGELRNATRLTAVIGIDTAMAEAYGKGSATFLVEILRKGTWERVFASAVLKYSDPAQKISVDITGAETLRLVCGDGGDGIACDHATWADAKLQR
jgi:hypothetical protein